LGISESVPVPKIDAGEQQHGAASEAGEGAP
jgi:hypothetical protein